MDQKRKTMKEQKLIINIEQDQEPVRLVWCLDLPSPSQAGKQTWNCGYNYIKANMILFHLVYCHLWTRGEERQVVVALQRHPGLTNSSWGLCNNGTECRLGIVCPENFGPLLMDGYSGNYRGGRLWGRAVGTPEQSLIALICIIAFSAVRSSWC